MYNIGQFRRTQLENYSSELKYTSELEEDLNSIVAFYNPSIVMNEINLLNNTFSYYLKFKVKQRTDTVQNFSVVLKNSKILEDNLMEIRSYEVKKGTEENYFELIFTPNSEYDKVIFDLDRLSFDFTYTDPETEKNGRIMKVEILDFYIVNNIISNYLSSKYAELDSIKRIGIQGPPGLIFVIDGEEMRIGRSGIYELTEDISISYIGFIIKDSLFTQDGKDYFIMDFKY